MNIKIYRKDILIKYMKRKTLLEALLLEHINVEGAQFIATDGAGGIDLFRIDTWDAAQAFVLDSATNRQAGTVFTQSQNLFNQHIANGQNKLYFYVLENTNRVIHAALYNHNATDLITLSSGQQYRVRDYSLEGLPGRNIPDELLTEDALNWLPDATVTPVRTNNNVEENNISDIEISGTVIGDNETDVESNNNTLNVAGNTTVVTNDTVADDANTPEPENTTDDVNANNNNANNTLTRNTDIKIKIVNGEGIVVGVRKKIYPNGTLTIPEFTEDGIPITTIAPFAFYGISLYKLNCPDIKEIKNFAFYNSDIDRINYDKNNCKKYMDSLTRE